MFADALDVLTLTLAALSLIALVVAMFLPRERWAKLLRTLGRKWIM